MSQQLTSKPGLDANLVNCVMNATIEVLRTMAGVDVIYKGVKAQKDYQPSGDISAIIGFAGEQGEGMVALSFPLTVSNYLVGKLLGIHPNALASEDRSDGVGELVNMISGNTKAALANITGSKYNLSLPSVIVGHNHEITSRPRQAPYLVLVFEVESQEFIVQISFKAH